LGEPGHSFPPLQLGADQAHDRALLRSAIAASTVTFALVLRADRPGAVRLTDNAGPRTLAIVGKLFFLSVVLLVASLVRFFQEASIGLTEADHYR
jgi:hypothetical protein